MARKDRTTQPDDASIAQDFTHALRGQHLVIEGLALDPTLTAIGFNHHRKGGESRRMGGDARLDRPHDPGSWRMDCRRNPLIGGPDALPLAYLIAGFDQRQGRAANVLMQRHDQEWRQRRAGNR